MIGIIDVGGGTRDIFGSGVFDYCLDNKLIFDYCIGVSAGSANCASYAAGQRGRNYEFYTNYAFRKEYMSINNFIKTGSYVDLNYIYKTLSNSDGENPLDYDEFKRRGMKFGVVATDALSGKPVYYSANDKLKKDDYRILMASCCTPIVCKPYEINGIQHFDGGISDPIPLKKAFEDGCDKVAIILTKPADVRESIRNSTAISHLFHSKYKESAKVYANRPNLYNKTVEKALELQKQGKVKIIAPTNIGKMRVLTKDKEQIKNLYNQGYSAGKQLKEWFVEK